MGPDLFIELRNVLSKVKTILYQKLEISAD